MESHLTFDDKTILAIFGSEDAESESIERLKEYYLKKNTFERVTTDAKVRILVGHKGTGKSALFKVAISEESESGNLPILIRPDDIAELGINETNFILRIRQWKEGLRTIIKEKVLKNLDLYERTAPQKTLNKGYQLTKWLVETITVIKDNVDITESEKLLVNNFLRKKEIIIYIDDLDRGWEGAKDDITRISALLNAIRDLSNDDDGIRFKISLRSDVYFLVKTSDESTDKIEGSVVWCEWTNHEILVMLVKRIQTFFGKDVNYDNLLNTSQFHLRSYLDNVFEQKFEGKGRWSNTFTYKVLMSMVRKRPRDLVKLCTLAAQNAKANGKSIIGTDNLQSIFEAYSQGRIQDTINEFKTELPNIEKLLYGMKPTKKEKDLNKGFIYTTPELISKINNILQNHKLTFKDGRRNNKKAIAQFLYKINFLTARKELDNGEIQRKYFEENRYLSSEFVDFGYDWEVHPAFRWALQPDDVNDLFHKISVNSDDYI